MENDKLSIESPTMNMHSVLEHAKKLEAMIKRVAAKTGIEIENDMFQFEQEIDRRLAGSNAPDSEETPVSDEAGVTQANEGDANAEESEKPQA